MFAYILRRIIYAIPILLGVNVLTFILFFMVNSPDDIARMQLGAKYITSSEIEQWKVAHHYDKPLFFNAQQSGLKKISDTLFFTKSIELFAFNFGSSLRRRNICFNVQQRMWPSLALAVPTLLIGLVVYITIALLLAFFRGSYVDVWGSVILIIAMSVSVLFYIIGGQYLLAKILQLVPVSGYHPGLSAIKFLILPVTIGIVGAIGANVRWYRTLFLEEINKEYVKTAYAKGLSPKKVLFKHVLKNALIPILTGVVVIIPLLFLGSLIMESFFGIPGLGSYTIDAIAQQDFDIVRVMVFLGTVFYILGLILTDISYTLVDPRVRLD